MFFAMFEWNIDWDSWETISNSDHRSATDKVQQDKRPSDGQKFASMTGARYYVLFQLSYYDAVWFASIDPMHFKVDRLQIIVVAKNITVLQLFISGMPKICAILLLVSAPLNPIPILEHFRRSHPQCEDSYGQHMYMSEENYAK